MVLWWSCTIYSQHISNLILFMDLPKFLEIQANDAHQTNHQYFMLISALKISLIQNVFEVEKTLINCTKLMKVLPNTLLIFSPIWNRHLVVLIALLLGIDDGPGGIDFFPLASNLFLSKKKKDEELFEASSMTFHVVFGVAVIMDWFFNGGDRS